MIFAVLAMTVVGFQSAPEAQRTMPEPSDVVAIAEVLTQLNDTASRADGAAYFDLFTPNARFIGTDVTERWSISEFKAYANPIFDAGRGWTYQPRDRLITITDNGCRCIAWFDEILENATYGTTRGSGVLTKTDNGWKIEQYVLSFTVPNEVATDVTALIRAAPEPPPESEAAE